jgi:hypothetical protein
MILIFDGQDKRLSLGCDPCICQGLGCLEDENLVVWACPDCNWDRTELGGRRQSPEPDAAPRGTKQRLRTGVTPRRLA